MKITAQGIKLTAIVISGLVLVLWYERWQRPYLERALSREELISKVVEKALAQSATKEDSLGYCWGESESIKCSKNNIPGPPPNYARSSELARTVDGFFDDYIDKAVAERKATESISHHPKIFWQCDENQVCTWTKNIPGCK